MKNLSLISQSAIAIAVIILYYLHFHSGEAGTPLAMPVSASRAVYVNLDTLLNNYNYYKVMKDSFEAKQKKMSEDLATQEGKLESAYKSIQQQAQSGNMTAAEKQQNEQKLASQQQELMGYKEEKEQELAQESQKVNGEIFTKIRSYLGELNKQYNYQYVFGYTKEGNILFAHDSLDITKQVLVGLNK